MRRSTAQSVKAPVGGLNLKDSIADMSADYALVMDNWFPDINSVSVRGGSLLVSTASGSIETLMTYTNGNDHELYAATSTNIYDVNTAPASSVVGSLTGGRWSFVNFTNAAGVYLVCCNGADDVKLYDGSTWASAVITGVSMSSLCQVGVWRKRLFFVEKDSQNLWYLGTQSVAASSEAATKFSLGGVFELGGKIVCCGSISSSAGYQVTDYFYVITSEGEVAIYSGSDINATDLSLVGVYRMSKPMANGGDNQGDNCTERFASDILVITNGGIQGLQDIIHNDVVTSRKNLMDKVLGAISTDAQSYGETYGWKILLCPEQNKLIVNVPTTASLSKQYVMNTITGAWCTFSGWNYQTLAYMDRKIYGATGSTVYQLDLPGYNDNSTDSDDGDPITCKLKTSFQYYGGRGNIKSYKMVRPVFYTTRDVLPYINIDVDYQATIPDTTGAVGTGGDIYYYDSSFYDSARYSVEEFLYSEWLGLNGMGYCAALNLNMAISHQKCRLHAFDVLYSIGGLI